jgi:hypothetical protein
LGEFKHRHHLFARNSRKPFQEFIGRRATFEVFEESFDWDARILEKQGAADLAFNALDRLAFGPIQHTNTMARAAAKGKIGDFTAAVFGIWLRTGAIGDFDPVRRPGPER